MKIIGNILLALAFAVSLGSSAMAEGKTHYIAMHIDENDPALMNLVLNNVQNVAQAYAAMGDSVMVEVVAYGPGLVMYIDGKSPVADRIAAMSLELEGKVSFSACGNTMRKMAANSGAEVRLIDEAVVVPAGVVRLVELQEQGYSYIRP
jgi:intracellular sulfur oxidation DsrE/DsrF family protein